MNKPGEVRFVKVSGEWFVYVRGIEDTWRPVNVYGPIYLSDMEIDQMDWEDHE